MSEAETLSIPKTAEERGKIAPAYMAHIVFKTPRFEEMKSWWCTVLEAKPTMQNANLAFLTFDGEHHRVAIANVPALLPLPKMMRGMDHVAFTYTCLQALLSTYERLKDLGIEPVWAINHGPTTSLYYADPDGNKAELQIENFDCTEDMMEWAQSGDFSINPIGVDFDPEDLCKRLAAGESEDSLKKRPASGPRKMSSIPVAISGRIHNMLAKLARQ